MGRWEPAGKEEGRKGDIYFNLLAYITKFLGWLPRIEGATPAKLYARENGKCALKCVSHFQYFSKICWVFGILCSAAKCPEVLLPVPHPSRAHETPSCLPPSLLLPFDKPIFPLLLRSPFSKCDLPPPSPPPQFRNPLLPFYPIRGGRGDTTTTPPRSDRLKKALSPRQRCCVRCRRPPATSSSSSSFSSPSLAFTCAGLSREGGRRRRRRRWWYRSPIRAASWPPHAEEDLHGRLGYPPLFLFSHP